MLYKNELRDMMLDELPSTGYQKRLGYRTNYDEVVYTGECVLVLMKEFEVVGVFVKYD